MDVERLVTRAIAGLLVFFAAGYLFRNAMTHRPRADQHRLQTPPQEIGLEAPGPIGLPAGGPSSDQIAGGMVPPQVNAAPVAAQNTAPEALPHGGSGTESRAGRKPRPAAGAGGKTAAGEYWTRSLEKAAPSRPGPGQPVTELTGELRTLIDHIPPDVRAAAEKEPYLLARYKEAMRELADAIGGSEAAYAAALNGDYSKLEGDYARRAEQDSGDRTVYNPAGPCGDYPLKWCKMAPNAVVSFGGGSHLNRRSACYVSWKRWSLGLKTALDSGGNRPGSSQTPTVGSAAIWDIGPARSYGHIAYVTAVNADSITIGEFDHRPYVYTSRTIKRGSRGWPDRFIP